MTLRSMRDLLGTEMVPGIAAVVALHEGEELHYGLTDEGYIFVTVNSQQGAPIRAHLSNASDDDGTGIWRIPAIGTEVFVVFPDGDYESEAYIVGTFAGRRTSLPPGLSPGGVIMQGTQVIARAVGGIAHPLATKADVDALASFVQSMSLPVSGATAGPPTPGSVPVAAGTTILKGQ